MSSPVGLAVESGHNARALPLWIVHCRDREQHNGENKAEKTNIHREDPSWFELPLGGGPRSSPLHALYLSLASDPVDLWVWVRLLRILSSEDDSLWRESPLSTIIVQQTFHIVRLKMKWIGRLSIDIRFLFFFFLFYVLLMWKRSNIRLLCFFDWKISSTIYIIVRTYIDNRAIFIFQWKKGNAKKVKRERFIVDVCYNQPITSMNEDVNEMMCGRYETRVFRY